MKGNDQTNVLAGFIAGTAITILLHEIIYKSKRKHNRKILSSNEEERNPQSIQSKAKILLVGCGGVGSQTAIMLAKSKSISFLRIIDFDQITLSSLNRHACATLKDVGHSKVQVLKQCIQNEINNTCYCYNIEDKNEMYRYENREELLQLPDGSYDWDIVIDAIDDVDTKCVLLTECYNRNLKVISCMGAGGKSDPTRIHISDLKVASRDPLAAKIRARLKKGGVNIQDWENLNVVYSSEKTVVKLAELSEEQKKGGEGDGERKKYGAVDGMRVRVIPVLGTMPAIMGQSIASWVVSQIEGRPFWPNVGERVGREVRHKIYQHFKNREKRLYDTELATLCKEQPQHKNDSDIIKTSDKWVGPLQVDLDEIDYLLTEIWQNRCAISGERTGTVLALVRWDISKPSISSNLVLMGNQALHLFDKSGKESFGRNVVAKIECRLKWLEENNFGTTT